MRILVNEKEYEGQFFINEQLINSFQKYNLIKNKVKKSPNLLHSVLYLDGDFTIEMISNTVGTVKIIFEKDKSYLEGKGEFTNSNGRFMFYSGLEEKKL